MLVAMIIYGGVAQAMQPHTRDITKKILDITANFDALIRCGNFEMAKTSYAECKAAYDSLYSYLEKYKPAKDASGHLIELLPE